MNDAATTPGGSDRQMAGPQVGSRKNRCGLRCGRRIPVPNVDRVGTHVAYRDTAVPTQAEGVCSDLQRGDVTQRARRGSLDPLAVRRVGISSVSAGSSFAPSPDPLPQIVAGSVCDNSMSFSGNDSGEREQPARNSFARGGARTVSSERVSRLSPPLPRVVAAVDSRPPVHAHSATRTGEGVG